jgi:D-alanine-D-alanine ligase-like ATP-grasp enzyme
MSALQYKLWAVPIYRKIDLVRSWVRSRLLPLHYIVSYYLGVVKFTPILDEELSNRAKVMWQAALDRGAEIEMGQVYGKSRELFRVRFPRSGVQSGSQHVVQKTRWFYFRSLPLVPWKDRTYTQWIDDKFLLKEFLRAEHIHVPLCRSVKTLAEAQAAMRGIQEERRGEKKEERNEKGDVRNEAGPGTLATTAHESAPVVVKPRQGSRSRHTSIGVCTADEMNSAFMKSRTIAHHIVVEEQLFGKVCRATLVDGTLAGFCAMTHAQVVGNGMASIGELIREKNDKRNKRVQSELSLENPDVYPLREKGYTLDTVLPAGEVFELKQRAGWMYGGEGREMVTDVHPQLVKTLERAAELLGAQLVAFDLVIEDPEADPAPQTWGIIEANSVPYIEVHIMPTVGERVNVGLILWDMWKEIPTWWR